MEYTSSWQACERRVYSQSERDLPRARASATPPPRRAQMRMWKVLCEGRGVPCQRTPGAPPRALLSPPLSRRPRGQSTALWVRVCVQAAPQTCCGTLSGRLPPSEPQRPPRKAGATAVCPSRSALRAGGRPCGRGAGGRQAAVSTHVSTRQGTARLPGRSQEALCAPRGLPRWAAVLRKGRAADPAACALRPTAAPTTRARGRGCAPRAPLTGAETCASRHCRPSRVLLLIFPHHLKM